MWIRSQTKEDLIDCNEFCITYNAYNPIEYRIRGNDLIVGKYSTKEKALKVLDKLESYIMLPNIVIFQMPLDSEVIVDE